GIQDVTGEEFAMFMAFLQGLALFGAKAPAERMQELVEIVEGQADLLASFDVSHHPHTLHCTLLSPSRARLPSLALPLSRLLRPSLALWL
ncbi:unnamed protein product, partial [Closterium sp. NIES-53]